MQKKVSISDLKKLGGGKEKIFLDLGRGKRKRSGYIGVDTADLPGVDVVCNIEKGLPFEDDSIDGIYSSFLFEHISDTIFLFQEVYRVSKKDALIEFSVPYYQSMTQYKDPTHCAIITPETLAYFTNEDWYGSDYGINTNFETVEIKYQYLKPFNYFAHKKLFFLWPITYPIVLFSRRFLWNVVHSIIVKLRVVK